MDFDSRYLLYTLKARALIKPLLNGSYNPQMDDETKDDCDQRDVPKRIISINYNYYEGLLKTYKLIQYAYNK